MSGSIGWLPARSSRRMAGATGLLVSGLLLAVGCGTRLERLPPGAVTAPQEPPRIGDLHDLGIAELPPGARVPVDGGDRRFLPGELVAIEGRGLRAGTALDIDGRPLDVVAHLAEGGVVARLPRGLAPGVGRRLRATTALGSDAVDCAVHGWAIVADTDGDALRFVPMPGEEGAPFATDDDVVELALRRARAIAVSPDGARCYAIQTAKHDDDAETPAACSAELAVVDLVAAKRPRRSGGTTLALPSPPERLAALPGARLAVLCRQHLVLLDVARPDAAATLALPGADARFASLATMRGGARLLALDIVGNRVLAIDLDPAPRVAAEAALLPGVARPWSVGVAADPAGETAWAILGPNHRTIAARLAALKPGAGDPGPVPAAARVVRLTGAGGTLGVEPLAELPADVRPIHATAVGGALWISGVAGATDQLRGLALDGEGLRRAVAVLIGAPRLGRLLRIDTASGAVDTPVRGMAVYTTLAAHGDGRPVSALLRLRVRPFPPALGIELGLECAGAGFVPLRELSWWSVIPPYGLGEVAVP